MEGLLTFLFIVVVVFWAFSLIIKLIFRRKMRKLEKQMHENSFDEPQQNEQKIHVDPDIGEYTDFEEIE